MADVRSQQPRVEDYYSDDSDAGVVLESFRRSSPAAASANVAAKRSQPSDLGTESAPAAEKVVHIDLQSDSGYSSHTVATMSSADSAPSATSSQSPPIAPASAAPAHPASPANRRRSTIVQDDRNDRNDRSSSPRKPLQRNSSVSSRPSKARRPTVTEECRDPTCTKCGPNARPSRTRRPEPSPLDSGLDISYPPFDQRSQRSDPSQSYTTPPSPTYTRQPASYLQGPAIVQPAQTRRRSSSTNPRPMSYHGGSSQDYWPTVPGGYPSPPQEHGHLYGPPPSMSATYAAMHQSQQMAPYMMGATPPNNYYPTGQSAHQTSPPYEMQRPPLSARNSSNYVTRRPQSQYGPTVVTQEQDRPLPSARYAPAPTKQPERLVESESDSESSEEEYERKARNARALMPPPQLTKVVSQRRPSLRHAKTDQVYHTDRRMSMSQSQMMPERPRERDPRDPRASRVSSAAPTRASSVSRPALIQHPKAQSAHETPREARVVVENSKSRRRQSYQGQSYDRELAIAEKRANRNSKIYRDGREDAIAPPNHRRRQTDTELRRRDEKIVEPKEKRAVLDAEAYQQRTRGSDDPFNDQIHKAAKKASRVPSDGSSSRSRGDDNKSRVSHRTNATNANGEIRLRVDASAPLSLQFNGDMEGRTLQINPAENGMADIVIGNHTRENESVYRSERGSVLGSSSRRSLVAHSARRDAEESSIKSERSSQSRRESERRPLRRRREMEYY